MKVLNCFLDNRFGGPLRRAYFVAKKLKKHNIETIFLFNEKEESQVPIRGFKCFLIKHAQCLTHESTVLNFLLFICLLPYNLYRLYRIIKTEGITIIHINGIMNILPVIPSKLTGTELVWHLNDTLTPWLLRGIFLPLVKLFTHRITIAAENVGKFYFGTKEHYWKKTTVLYAPVDIEKFKPGRMQIQTKMAFRSELGINGADYVIGTIGNINPAKGFEYFITAAKQIKEQMENTKFIIVGKRLSTAKSYCDKLQSMVSEYNLQGHLLFVGFSEDITKVLSALDIFVLSSVSEACPIVVLEAMAMKTPVVATDVGGVNEQIQNGYTGFLVPPRDPQAIAEKVLKLLATPKSELGRMTNNARRRVESIFSLGEIAEQHKNLYLQLLGKE